MTTEPTTPELTTPAPPPAAGDQPYTFAGVTYRRKPPWIADEGEAAVWAAAMKAANDAAEPATPPPPPAGD